MAKNVSKENELFPLDKLIHLPVPLKITSRDKLEERFSKRSFLSSSPSIFKTILSDISYHMISLIRNEIENVEF